MSGFWLIGCGNMAGAMLQGWIDGGLDPAIVTVIDPGLPDITDVTVICDLPATTPDTVMIGVKPQLLDVIAPDLAPRLGNHTILLSILAGVDTETLRHRFSAPDTIVRVMPNTPAAIGKGVIAMFSNSHDTTALASIEDLMQPLGLVEWIGDEALFDAVTALSGCGPAFLFRFVEALADAGAALGLPVEQAARFALATVEGAALLAVNANETPQALADKVASAGGATREGLNVLDENDALKRLLIKTLEAAKLKSAELAANARS